jgi:dienelactone hydrolase
MPAELPAFEPPYPALIQLHGGGSRKELHWWSSQSMAEQGYIVIVPDGAGQAVARAALDALFDESDARFVDFDRQPVGIAGHSIGGDAASIVAHTDRRIGAYVGWDRAGLSSPAPEIRGDAPPSLHINGDYGCPAPLVCPPEPRTDYPDPAARGAKGLDYEIAREHGIDTMVVWLRAALHFDWVPSELSGNRYVELLNIYYMGAWYDRYLKGDTDPAIAADAFDRLTATVFDASADVHNISQGTYDHQIAVAAADLYAGNVPYTIEAMPVADRLSFYYLSKADISVPGTGARAMSEDIRNDGFTISS